MSYAQRLGELLLNLARSQRRWSYETFGGSERGPTGPLKHLAKEAIEAAEAPPEKRLEERADCLILLLDATWRSGDTLLALLYAAQAKMEVNKQRQWPAPTPDGPCEHVREVSK